MDIGAELAALSFRGMEHIRAALDRGRGAILLESSFFGLRHLAKRALHARGCRLHQTHSMTHLAGFVSGDETKLRSRIVRPLFQRREEDYLGSVISIPSVTNLSHLRQLAGCLANNGLLCISGDGQVGLRHIERIFLGRPRRFGTGMYNLARMTGSPILPVFCYMGWDRAGEFVVEQPLEVPDGRDGPAVGIEQFATMLERLISLYPEQYRSWQAWG
jgi:lauroyl/myristoyl acyltransferase